MTFPFPAVVPPGARVPKNAHLYSDYSVVATATFSGVPLGVEHATRHIVVGVASGNSNTVYPSSVTVAGVSATLLAQTSTASTLNTSLWIAAVPTGTSGNVVVTNPSATWNNTSVAALYLSSATPVATNSDEAGATVDVSANVTGPNGVAVGYVFYNNAYTMTPTGFSVQDSLASNVYKSDFCLADGLSTETPRTLQFAFSGSNNEKRGVSATFQGA